MSLSCYPKLLRTFVFEPSIKFSFDSLYNDTFKTKVDNYVDHTSYENAPSVPIEALSVQHERD